MTVTDNAILHVSEPFTKTWRLKNVGTCTWTMGYKVVFAGGEKMSGPASVSLPINVAPTQTVDVSVPMSAPNVAGHYEGFWQLQSGNGTTFGIGDSAKDAMWVRIRVITPAFSTSTTTPGAPTATAPIFTTATATPGLPTLATAVGATATPDVSYDLATNVCAAQWQSNDGVLPCPGLNGDASGFVLEIDPAHLEDGTTAELPTILTYPQASAEGYILGVYPDYEVKDGDHFQTTVGCEQNATSCSVLFRLSYLDFSSAPHDLWTLGEFYDGKYFNLDLDLSRLAGQKIKLILNLGSLGSATGDRALWVAPRIVHFELPTSTPSSSPTPTIPASTFTPSPTMTLLPTAVPPSVAATPVPANSGQAPSFSQVVQSIVSFFQQLLGGH